MACTDFQSSKGISLAPLKSLCFGQMATFLANACLKLPTHRLKTQPYFGLYRFE